MAACKCSLTQLLILAIGWSISSAFPSGAPGSRCESMTPDHRVSAMTGTPPFTVTASQTSYYPGDVITVTISGTNSFRGFFLQARDENDRHVGNFNAISGTRVQACDSGDAATHSSPLPANTQSISLQWTAPSPRTVGPVTFLATVVERTVVFWVKIPGPTLQETSVGQDSCQLPSSANSLAELSLQSASVSWKKPSSGKVEFTVRAAVGTLGGAYVSIGFSMDNFMGDDSVVDCMQQGNSGTVSIQSSYTFDQPKNRLPLSNPMEGLEFVSGSRQDGVLQCVFKRDINTPDPQFFDLASQRYRLFVAVGEISPQGAYVPHPLSSTKRPVISAEKIDFLYPGYYRTLK